MPNGLCGAFLYENGFLYIQDPLHQHKDKRERQHGQNMRDERHGGGQRGVLAVSGGNDDGREAHGHSQRTEGAHQIILGQGQEGEDEQRKQGNDDQAHKAGDPGRSLV